MAAGGKNRDAREQRERARRYQARAAFQTGLRTRRTRDNVLAGVVGGIVIVAAFAAQSVYFSFGPGAPEPAPTPSMSSTPAPSPTLTGTPAPTATESPAP
ncbi:dioxygenase [Microbacterium sp. C7(2022)]|uniref:dioxygenase n=1 Tax=Microbacterium sp. C7(2022) TaxID=2992759 RepID=UPI00237BECD3|nr:dioxygenase [Microbacterium sp. C7(2022)]MDE0545532.1 dioxygenase [Microbacterium sp. C7(2022)]